MNLSDLAAHGTKLDLALAEARGQVKVTRLAPVKPRRSQLVFTTARVGGSRQGTAQKVG